MDLTPTQAKIGAIGLVGILLGTILLAVGFYTRAFDNPAIVTVEAGRSGLIMAPGNNVKARGVEIGRVSKVEPSGTKVRLELEIDRDEIAAVPADAQVVIKASTAFGAKYVDLVSDTTEASARSLEDGAVLQASSVTTEVNTLFERLDSVLQGVDVPKLNGTLTTLSVALGGRGDDVADLASSAEAYLSELEPQLPQLRRDLVEIATFSSIADEVSPELIAILDNATVTARTITSQQESLDRLLVDLTLLGDSGARVIKENRAGIIRLLRDLEVPLSTLAAYETELPCFIQGVEKTRQIMTKTFGGVDPGLRATLSIRSKRTKYSPPEDLPRQPTRGGPSCHGLPDVPRAQIPIPEVGEPE